MVQPGKAKATINASTVMVRGDDTPTPARTYWYGLMLVNRLNISKGNIVVTWDLSVYAPRSQTFDFSNGRLVGDGPSGLRSPGGLQYLRRTVGDVVGRIVQAVRGLRS
jgi:hypothetical protein